MIHQCHRCELRFATEGELNDHLGHDHRVDSWVFEPFRYPAERDVLPPLYEESPATPVERRYLVVANQTLGGEALNEHVRSCVAAGPASFYLVVPATHSAHHAVTGRTYASPASGRELPGPTDERGLAQARWRLRRGVELFRTLGAQAAGEVGSPDPIEAVGQVLERERFDEVIVSMLPTSTSRWLGMDVPQRIERRWKVPVTTVVVTPAPAGQESR